MIMHIRRSYERFFEIFSVWFFGDVIFAVIPLGVIAFITYLLKRNFTDFSLLKEWSFASIVFYGASIRQLMRLKIEVQRIPRSFTLDTGVQLYIVMLIASTLVLALVILIEFGVVRPTVSTFIAKSQVSLFILGLCSTLITAYAINEGGELETTLKGRSKRWALERVVDRLEGANSSLQHAVCILEKLRSLKPNLPSDEIWERISVETRYAEVLGELTRAEHFVETLRNSAPTKVQSPGKGVDIY